MAISITGGRRWAPVADRADLVAGRYFPDATTTGLSDTGASRITQATNITFADVTASIKTIANTDFYGTVFIPGKHYRFPNCRFWGPLVQPSNNPASVLCRYDTTEDIVFTDCVFKARSQNVYTNNIIGCNWSADCCDFSSSIDGFGPAVADGQTRTDVVVTRSWVHGLMRFCPDSTHSDNQSHSDGFQWAGGLGVRVQGSRIEGLLDTAIGSGWGTPAYDGGGVLTTGAPFYPNPVSLSAVMVNTAAGANPGEFVFEDNWLRGGGVGINTLGVPTAFTTNDGVTSIQRNRVANDQGFGTNHRLVGKASQTGLDAAIGTNWVWDLVPGNELSTATVLPSFKVNA